MGVDAGGNPVDSSNEVLAITANTPPNPSIGLVTDQTSITTNSIRLAWQAATDPDGAVPMSYNVYFSTISGADYNFAGNVTATSFVVNGLSSNTVYYCIVKAIDSAGAESAASNEASAKTRNQVPDAPFNVIADTANITSNNISITWSTGVDNDGSITGYNIYCKQDSDSVFQKKATITGNSYTLASLNPSTRYYIYVTATDNDGAESVPSNTIAVYTKADSTSPVDPNINTGGLPDSGTYYFHPDHVGSIKYVTDATGNVVYRMAYDPFGTVLRDKSTGTSGDEFPNKYCAHRDDQSTGLTYMKARYYDSGIGRFISADSVIPNYKKSQAFNRYSYVENNPENSTDPSGHNPVVIGAIIGAVVGGVIGGTHGDILHPSRWDKMRWDWKAAGKGAAIGAVIGASAGISPTGFVVGSLNAYYVKKRGGSNTDMAVAYGIGWEMGAACSGEAQAYFSGGEASQYAIASDFSYPLLGYAVQGYCISGATNFYTQTYLVIKKSIKEKRFAYDEFKWKDFAIAAFVTGPIGSMLTNGLGGDDGVIGGPLGDYIGKSTAVTLFIGSEYYQSHQEKNKTPLVKLIDQIIGNIESSWNSYTDELDGKIEDIFNVKGGNNEF